MIAEYSDDIECTLEVTLQYYEPRGPHFFLISVHPLSLHSVGDINIYTYILTYMYLQPLSQAN